jgi:hypothetical protein
MVNTYAGHRILAQATVELIEKRSYDGISPTSLWEVTVNGLPPFDYKRVYTIESKTDNNAAQDGIRQFVEEMENLKDSVAEGS